SRCPRLTICLPKSWAWRGWKSVSTGCVKVDHLAGVFHARLQKARQIEVARAENGVNAALALLLQGSRGNAPGWHRSARRHHPQDAPLRAVGQQPERAV